MNTKQYKILRKHKKEIMDFIFTAPLGSELQIEDIKLKKDFTIGSLGFKPLTKHYYTNDEGQVVSKTFISELIWESLLTEPQVWLS